MKKFKNKLLILAAMAGLAGLCSNVQTHAMEESDNLNNSNNNEIKNEKIISLDENANYASDENKKSKKDNNSLPINNNLNYNFNNNEQNEINFLGKKREKIFNIEKVNKATLNEEKLNINNFDNNSIQNKNDNENIISLDENDKDINIDKNKNIINLNEENLFYKNENDIYLNDIYLSLNEVKSKIEELLKFDKQKKCYTDYVTNNMYLFNYASKRKITQNMYYKNGNKYEKIKETEAKEFFNKYIGLNYEKILKDKDDRYKFTIKQNGDGSYSGVTKEDKTKMKKLLSFLRTECPRCKNDNDKYYFKRFMMYLIMANTKIKNSNGTTTYLDEKTAEQFVYKLFKTIFINKFEFGNISMNYNKLYSKNALNNDSDNNLNNDSDKNEDEEFAEGFFYKENNGNIISMNKIKKIIKNCFNKDKNDDYELPYYKIGFYLYYKFNLENLEKQMYEFKDNEYVQVDQDSAKKFLDEYFGTNYKEILKNKDYRYEFTIDKNLEGVTNDDKLKKELLLEYLRYDNKKSEFFSDKIRKFKSKQVIKFMLMANTKIKNYNGTTTYLDEKTAEIFADQLIKEAKNK